MPRPGQGSYSWRQHPFPPLFRARCLACVIAVYFLLTGTSFMVAASLLASQAWAWHIEALAPIPGQEVRAYVCKDTVNFWGQVDHLCAVTDEPGTATRGGTTATAIWSPTMIQAHAFAAAFDCPDGWPYLSTLALAYSNLRLRVVRDAGDPFSIYVVWNDENGLQHLNRSLRPTSSGISTCIPRYVRGGSPNHHLCSCGSSKRRR